MTRRDATPHAQPTDATRGLVGHDAAEVYERDFVPALFAPFTQPVLDRVVVRPGDRVLDVGCGTGVLARAALARAGAGGVIGIDPDPGMLAVARRIEPGIAWHLGHAEELPLADHSVDVVASQFAWMFVADHRAAAAEVDRVLRPGGRVSVATWASIERNAGFAAMHALLDELFGSTIADGLLAPFSIGRPAQLIGLLADTFADVEVVEAVRSTRFASIDEWVHTEIRGWTLSASIDDEMYDRFLAEARRRWTRFTRPDGAVEFWSPALLASATRPG